MELVCSIGFILNARLASGTRSSSITVTAPSAELERVGQFEYDNRQADPSAALIVNVVRHHSAAGTFEMHLGNFEVLGRIELELLIEKAGRLGSQFGRSNRPESIRRFGDQKSNQKARGREQKDRRGHE
jgi:hypothetical protein